MRTIQDLENLSYKIYLLNEEKRKLRTKLDIIDTEIIGYKEEILRIKQEKKQ